MGKLHVLAVALLIAAAPQAKAQTEPPAASGLLTAHSYQAIPPGAAITIEAADDSDQYQRLKAAITTALRERGYQVVDDGPYVLEFYATEVIGSSGRDRSNGARATQSAVPGGDQAQSMGVLSGLNQNLFGNEASSGGTNQAAAEEPRRVHLSMMLSDQHAARRVWQGTASGELRRPGSFAATQSLVPFLVNRVGATVSNERFEMP